MKIKTKTVNTCQLMFLILKRFIKMTFKTNRKLKDKRLNFEYYSNQNISFIKFYNISL
jgi:hypothetical protein